jgi:hypothetical protein
MRAGVVALSAGIFPTICWLLSHWDRRDGYQGATHSMYAYLRCRPPSVERASDGNTFRQPSVERKPFQHDLQLGFVPAWVARVGFTPVRRSLEFERQDGR